MGEWCSVEFGGKAPVIFLSENSAPFFPGVSATASTHLVTTTPVPEFNSFHGRSSPEFWHRISTSFHDDLRPKNWNFLSQVPLTKRVLLSALRLRPVIWLLSSSSTSPCYVIHSGYYNDLYIPFSVQPTWGCGVQIAWPLFPTASAVSCRAVSSNTDGEGKLNLTSFLSVAYHVTLPRKNSLKMLY